MSEIDPTDHKSITAPRFPDEDFREADHESVESERAWDNKLVEAEFSILKDYGRNKCHYWIMFVIFNDNKWLGPDQFLR